MRFLFEGGGRSGMRDVEALAHGLETWCDGFNQSRWRGLAVDHSPSFNCRGELFRELAPLLAEVSAAIEAERARRPTVPGPDMPAMWRGLAQRLWIEAETAELVRTANMGEPKAAKRL